MSVKVTKVKVQGKHVEHNEARLCLITFKGYWADDKGTPIDKISFGSTVRFYIDKFWAYDPKLKISIKSSDIEEIIVEDTINKLNPNYFVQREQYFEIKLKKQQEYKSLQNEKDLELYCGVSNGFWRFVEQEKVAKIKIEPTTPWMDIAIAELGTLEIMGKKHNPRIVEYHNTTSGKFQDDETPWCSSFVNWCLSQVGIAGTNNALAYSWKSFGMSLSKPAYGAIAVMNYSHVGFVAGINKDGRIILLGGNQSDAVNLSPNPTSLVITYRYPIGYEVIQDIPEYDLKGRSLNVSSTR